MQTANQPVNPDSFYPFLFQKIRLKEACWVNDQPCFTRLAIGEWLEYNKPQKAIDKLIERNPDLDDPQWSVTVRVTATDGKKYDQHVYNPIGFQLIIFESRQPKAKAYKIMVAKLVYAFTQGDLFPPHSREDLALRLDCEKLLELKPYYERPQVMRLLTEKHGCSHNKVHDWVQKLEHGKDPAAKPYGKHLKGRHHYISAEDTETIKRVARAYPQITAKQIIKIMPRVDCSAMTTVSRIKQSVKEQEISSKSYQNTDQVRGR